MQCIGRNGPNVRLLQIFAQIFGIRFSYEVLFQRGTEMSRSIGRMNRLSFQNASYVSAGRRHC